MRSLVPRGRGTARGRGRYVEGNSGLRPYGVEQGPGSFREQGGPGSFREQGPGGYREQGPGGFRDGPAGFRDQGRGGFRQGALQRIEPYAPMRTGSMPRQSVINRLGPMPTYAAAQDPVRPLAPQSDTHQLRQDLAKRPPVIAVAAQLITTCKLYRLLMRPTLLNPATTLPPPSHQPRCARPACCRPCPPLHHHSRH